MRVIAGSARGLRLKAPEGRGTRPMTDRVKESLFGTLASLGYPQEGDRVLDLYAGTGSLGIEALS
ncbi:MAG TPA: RsmD family RNA methyltransferase, partial [Chloroflexia bacterium]